MGSLQRIEGRMLDLLKDAARGTDGFVELRYHAKRFQSLLVTKGRLERSTIRHRSGVAVRVLYEGTWGFASTSNMDLASLREAIERARAGARASASFRQHKIPDLAPVSLATGNFVDPAVEQVARRSIEEKIQLALETEARARAGSSQVPSASCGYNEIFEDKAILTTDGAAATFSLVRPEFWVSVVAEREGERATARNAIGVTGGWECLFRDAPEIVADKTVKSAVDLLGAPFPEGGRKTVVLAPSVVGLMVHEAVGHTVEADLVQAGSVAAGKIGQRVASDLVTLCDSGRSVIADGAGGSIPIDDEGVPAEETVIIKDGILNSYLHNRESAATFGVAPTGNARAWEYSDEPLIRMRNTYIRPGNQTLEELIATTEDGYLLDGPRNGQADSTGEFMFGVQQAWRIQKGKLGELVRGVTITGKAFDVLQTVDGVSREFKWDLGSGHCGKGQPAKVDAGGPYVRCQAILAGVQD